MYLAKPNAVSLKAEHWFCDISTGVAETAATKKKSAITLVGLFSKDRGESDCSEWECRKNL